MSGRKQTLVCMVCLVGAVLLVFGRTIGGQFLDWDDRNMVATNPGLNPPSVAHTAEFWRRPYQRLYTPIAYTAWSAVAKAEDRGAGQALLAWPFHLLNLVLHAAGAILAFLLLRELFPSPAPPSAAWAGALLFAIHPLQTEPVAWIAGMNNLLCGGLSLAALWRYVIYAKSPVNSKRQLSIATALYAAALLSKPLAVVVPLMAVALDVWMIRRPIKQVVKPMALWVGMAIPTALIARTVQPPSIIAPLPLWARAWTAIDAIGFYAIKLFAPVNLVIDYQRTPQWVMDNPWSPWPGCVVLFVAVAVLLGFRVAPWFRAGLVIMLVALLPVLGLTPFDFQEYSTVADRYMYLPMFGVSILASGILSKARGLIPWTLTGMVLVLLAACAFGQAAVWHDTRALVQNELNLDPDNSTGHKILAAWYVSKKYDNEAEKQYQQAIADLLRDGKPGNGDVWFNYANLLARQKRYPEAIGQYQASLPRLTPDHLAAACNGLGVSLYHTRDIAGAREQFLKAAALDPAWPVPKNNLRLLDEKD